MFTSLLIANRGEIACRIIRTARRMGIRTIAVYSEADRDALHVRKADEAVLIGPAESTKSYLDVDAVMDAVRQTGAEALHPGYGFLSENQNLVSACKRANVIFVGPSVQSMRLMGMKDEAKRIMEAAGVPVTPGYHGEDQRETTLAKEAEKIGYPVLIKAVAGGGGRGMRRVDAADEFVGALESARREAKSAFGDDRVLVEKFIQNPRHIEVQVFGDRRGRIVHFYERDCSVQRRHQKVIEEAPAPGINSQMRIAVCAAAVAAARAVAYENAGTVEFIVDGSGPLNPDRFWFMEMNTRLQVEHPVSELVTGYDLVELQLKIAAGGSVPEQDEISLHGHAIEARLYAEDPGNHYMPSTGMLTHFTLPDENDVRVDTGFVQGDEVSEFYDPMLAKIIAYAPTRKLAGETLAKALSSMQSWPVRTNAGFLARCLTAPAFIKGQVDTGFIDNQGEALHSISQTPQGKAAVTALVKQMTMFENQTSDNPWQVHDGWRLNQMPSLSRAYSENGETWRVDLQHDGESNWLLNCDNITLRAQDVRSQGEVVYFEINGTLHRAQSVACSDGQVTFDNGDAWWFGKPNPEATTLDAEASTAVLAPMPGKVLGVTAKPGASVKKGETLVVLEAMKMEHALSASADALIAKVLVKPGAQVSEGDVLVRFEVPPETS